MNNKLQKVILDTLKLLSFQSFKLDASIFNWYLSFGILFTWLCGIGRYWDNPKADLWQYWGLGSVIYIFVLAFILWLLIMPLKPNNWSYKNILLFVKFYIKNSFFKFNINIIVSKFFNIRSYYCSACSCTTCFS